MTNEEARLHLKMCSDYCVVPNIEATELAIKALEQMDNCPVFSDDEVKQPCIESPCSKSNEVEDFKKFVESRLDMQDLYLPIHFFDLLDEYCGTDRKEANNDKAN